MRKTNVHNVPLFTTVPVSAKNKIGKAIKMIACTK